MVRRTRRDVLYAVGGVGAGFTGLMLGTDVASASVTVSGRVVAHDDEPVTNRVIKNYGEGSFDAYTNSEGEFSAETGSNARLNLTLYKGDESTLLAPVLNGVPHVYDLGDYYTEEGDTDLGKLRTPVAYRVRLQALDSEGNPVNNATPRVRHGGSGIGSHYMSTKSDGWAYINEADFDGIELAGSTLLSMEIPVDGGGAFKLEKRVTIDGPKTVTFQVGKGVTISNPDTSGSDSNTSDTSETDSNTSKNSENDSNTSEVTETSNPNTTTVSNSSERRSTDNITDTPEVNRGFFSNGEPANDLGPLDDPFTLTVGGFALSVIGIAYQMIRGY